MSPASSRRAQHLSVVALVLALGWPMLFLLWRAPDGASGAVSDLLVASAFLALIPGVLSRFHLSGASKGTRALSSLALAASALSAFAPLIVLGAYIL